MGALVTDGTEELILATKMGKSIRFHEKQVREGIAQAVAEVAFQQGLARRSRPTDLAAHIRSLMYQPEYPVYA